MPPSGGNDSLHADACYDVCMCLGADSETVETGEDI